MNFENNNQQTNDFVESLAASIIQHQHIDPQDKELIPILGMGKETNNHEAIKFWVNSSLHQMTDTDGSLLGILNENLFDELNSYSDHTQQTFTQH